jgi:hypothetical protein
VANRYWVGGTATWDGTALLKWSTTSGGIGGSAVPTTSDTVFFDANSGANTVTIGAGVATCSTLTMTGFTGTIAFGSNSITCAGTGTIYTGATTFSVTGTPLILCSNSSGTSRTITPTATTEANSISFNITAGTGTFNITASSSVKNLNFTGFTGGLALTARTIYGNLTLVSGMTLGSGTSIQTFAATSGTQTITSATLTQDYPIAFSGTATYQLVDAMTVGSTRTVTFTSGTLDLNNKTLTTGFVATSNSNTRSILFGTTGNIEVNGNSGTIWSATTATGFTYTGTPTINCTYSGSTGTRAITFGNTAGQTETNSLSFNISAGSDTVSLQGGFKNLNFTGFTGIFGNNTRTIYGNLTLNTVASGMTVTAGTLNTTFGATSGTQTITSAAQTLDFPVTINGVGGTVQLVDALTMGSTRTLTLTNGTFNSNDKSVTVGAFNYTNSNTKALNLGTSTITIQSGTNLLGFVGSNSGTTYTSIANSTIIFTTTATSTFSGGAGATVGNQFGTVTMSGLGGTLYLGPSTGTTVARCTTLNNTVQPCTITNSCTTGFTVTNFNLSGTAGKLVTFNSNTVGTARTISQASGTVNALYLNVQDSTATGGAKWYANSSNDLGNNTGWNIFNNSFLAVF